MSFDIKKVRQDFPNLAVQVHGKPWVYLDNAATTLKPQKVIDAITDHYQKTTSNIHRGVHFLSMKATEQYENSRRNIQKFINAKSSKEVIFTRGTTDSINVVVASYGSEFLREGDEILISEMEHHSNIVPWQMLCEKKGCILKVCPMNDAGEIELSVFESCVNEKTKFISLVYISNSLGTINPIKDMIAMAHKSNIPVLVDAAQAVLHDRIDVIDLDCEFLAFSGHKMFGPTGIGVLYGKESVLEKMSPYQGGGDMISSVTFEKTTYNQLPYKFEAGTPNIAGVIGLGAAVEYIESIGFENVKVYKQDVLDYGTKQLKTIDGLKLIGTAAKKTSVLAFVCEDIHAHDMGTLVDEEGVAIRTGHHCTQPVMKHFGIAATSRASLSWYNTKEEIDVLVEAVIKAKEVFR